MKSLTQHTMKQQQGMTLLVAMITLIVLMLLGIGSMVASNTMFKLAGNLQYENEAKNRAESTLTIAESYLMSGTVSQSSGFTTGGPTPSQTLPFYDPTATINPLTSWPSAASSPPSVTGGQFIIQLITPTKVSAPGQQTCLGCGPGLKISYNLFRVTARGKSGRGATRFVESIVQVP